MNEGNKKLLCALLSKIGMPLSLQDRIWKFHSALNTTRYIVLFLFLLACVMVAYAAKTNLLPYILGFVSGCIILIVLHYVIREIIDCLRLKGDIYEEVKSEKKISLSIPNAWLEQFLFFFAAMAGKEVFGWALPGWLFFKGIHQWSRWASPITTTDISLTSRSHVQANKYELSLQQYLEAKARNRFVILLIGTGMSIAAGGISGATYRYCRLWLENVII